MHGQNIRRLSKLVNHDIMQKYYQPSKEHMQINIAQYGQPVRFKKFDIFHKSVDERLRTKLSFSD